MKIAVFGLGYVGVVSAACLVRDGHDGVGVDPNELKAGFLRQGKSPIVEPGLDELIAAAVAAGRLGAGSDPAAAVAQCELLMVCVGTPGRPTAAPQASPSSTSSAHAAPPKTTLTFKPMTASPGNWRVLLENDG
jgi:UDP-glucose 6-dehydrogenase